MEDYIKITKVKAKLFEDGDQDGFETRYYNDDDIHEDGSITTWGLVDKHSIQVPYVQVKHRCRSIGFGREYLVINSNGEKSLVRKEVFEAEYTKTDAK